MVQRPFSEDGANANIVWKNMSKPLESASDFLKSPGYAQVKTLYHKMQRPKISTLLSSVENGRSMSTYSRIKIAKADQLNPMELRLPRNNFNNLTTMQSTTEESILFQPERFMNKNNSYPGEISVETFYQVPASSKFFPGIDDRDLQTVEQKINSKDNTIVIPADLRTEKDNNSLLVKGIFIADKNEKGKSPVYDVSIKDTASSEVDEKADFLLEEVAQNLRYHYNITANPYSCKAVEEVKTDIDTSSQFAYFDIEVSIFNHSNVQSSN